MSEIRPFMGVRPAKGYARDIAALPYDVYNKEEARSVVEDKPHSFLRIDRAEVNFDRDKDMYSKDVYQKANEILYKMLDEGKFIQDSKVCLYLYKLTMEGRSQVGLVTTTSIDDYLNNKIKKHELTRAQKEQDRINHVDYCDANTGPIFLTYRHEKTIDEMVEEWMTDHEAEYDFLADDGVGHTVWIVDDEAIVNKMVVAFEDVDSLYIADGHHRAASAVKVGLKRREQNPEYTGKEAFNYFLSVVFPDNQLYIMDYNRVVKDLNGLTAEEVVNEVKGSFNLLSVSKEIIKPVNKAEFSMYLDGQWYLFNAKDGTYNSDDPVLSLDVSILQLNLLAPILGIGDPRTDDRIDFVGGIRGLEELEKRVKTDMEIAFALAPTSIEELMNIADANKLMPPKSTWFEPKLRSGLFIHLLK